jgi:UDP-glucose 4-epimerase
MNKKILITGANGVIGKDVVELLHFKGYNIIELVRSINKKDQFQFDILNGNWSILENLFKDVNVLIHLAASLKIGENQSEIDELNKVNVDFTEYLLKLSVKNKVEKIIFSSTLSFIQKPLTYKINESSVVNPIYHYSLTKFKCEELIHKYANKYELNYAILRISSPIIFDFDKMHNNFLKKWISLSKKGEDIIVHGSGSRSQDFVATLDIANAVNLILLKDKINGVFNIASGSSISLIEIANLITGKYYNSYHLKDNDLIAEKWNISIEKAKSQLFYTPMYSSKQIIEKLLQID